MIHCDSACCFRSFEEKLKELEELQNELQGHVEELEEENDHLKKQNMMVNEAKIKLRQETSLLTAENMVCVCVPAEGSKCYYGRNQCLSVLQDLEEQLDQKNRLIKKLVSQLKSLETSHKGFCVSAVSLTADPLLTLCGRYLSLTLLNQ